jgi:CheY-like chemotaxis protein
MKNILSGYYDVRVAKSGELALYILGSVKVDLILLDIEMPGMSGFEFADTISEIPDIAQIPIIFVTSHATIKYVDRANKIGAIDYIVKPIKTSTMLEKVANVLRD